MTTQSLADRVREFRRLHESGCFVIPNPWDTGSARLLVKMGFRALATTSSGLAWSLGRGDTQVTLDDALRHFRAIANEVDVPVSADFESGYAAGPDALAANVALVCQTGVSGFSIEDSTKSEPAPLFDFPLAVERVRAARRAIDASGTNLVLTARSEGYLVGRPDLSETVRRLTAYAEAGADCLYAPRIRTREEIETIVRAVAPKAVNVLVGDDFTTVADLAALGVRRISVGGGLARSAWRGFLEAATEIAEGGTFKALGRAVPFAEIDGLLRRT